MGNSYGINSKANRAIDDYSIDNGIENKFESCKNSEELDVEEIPFSKYGFVKVDKNNNWKDSIKQ